MAKFRGKIGYAKNCETCPGVWEDSVTERTYRGDVIRNVANWQSTSGLNDNITYGNRISIIADDYAYSNIGYMRYVEWMGSLFCVTSIEIQRPRLIISLGGVYNGPTP